LKREGGKNEEWRRVASSARRIGSGCCRLGKEAEEEVRIGTQYCQRSEACAGCAQEVRKMKIDDQAAGRNGTNVGALCQELGISRQTLYRHVSPTGELRDDDRDVMSATQR